jgi:hypothetical protein
MIYFFLITHANTQYCIIYWNLDTDIPFTLINQHNTVSSFGHTK